MSKEPRRCRTCGKELTHKHNSWYCDKTCLIAKSTSISRSCAYCGNEFKPTNKASKFCSNACRDDLYAERERSSFTIFSRDDFKCIYCGKSSIEDGVRLVLDHVMPYNITHDNSIYNLVTCCFDCNFRKNERLLSPNVYDRIVQRNIEMNKRISPKDQEFVGRVLDEYFEEQKNG